MTKEVVILEFMGGRKGLKIGRFFTCVEEEFDGFSYSRMPATVVLSKVPMPVKYGLANMRNVALGDCGLVFRRTLVVCPGVMSNILVLRGLM